MQHPMTAYEDQLSSQTSFHLFVVNQNRIAKIHYHSGHAVVPIFFNGSHFCLVNYEQCGQHNTLLQVIIFGRVD